MTFFCILPSIWLMIGGSQSLVECDMVMLDRGFVR